MKEYILYIINSQLTDTMFCGRKRYYPETCGLTFYYQQLASTILFIIINSNAYLFKSYLVQNSTQYPLHLLGYLQSNSQISAQKLELKKKEFFYVFNKEKRKTILIFLH